MRPKGAAEQRENMRKPDAEVMFELTAHAWNGGTRRVHSGYRPHYNIRPDYLTSVTHRFVDAEWVATGQSAKAEVWFLTPEVYPHTLWVGRLFEAAEGSRQIGKATVLRVLNPLMLSTNNSLV